MTRHQVLIALAACVLVAAGCHLAEDRLHDTTSRSEKYVQRAWRKFEKGKFESAAKRLAKAARYGRLPPDGFELERRLYGEPDSPSASIATSTPRPVAPAAPEPVAATFSAVNEQPVSAPTADLPFANVAERCPEAATLLRRANVLLTEHLDFEGAYAQVIEAEELARQRDLPLPEALTLRGLIYYASRMDRYLPRGSTCPRWPLCD